MARADLLNILYTRTMSALEFNFEALTGPGVYELLDPYDIRYMKSITSHPKLNSKIKEKSKLIIEVMESRNFKKMVQGTNRICFKHFADERVVAKVALDDVGLNDNPAEYRNQNILKPYITKVFDVSEFGEVSTFERVLPVTSREQFLSIAQDVFDMLNLHIDGKYALDDIGSDYFLNYGIRRGFGPVLLDFPYVYEIDGKKLICNKKDEMSPTGYCMGEIDYDLGWNNLLCTKCGKRYFAINLKKDEADNKLKIEKKYEGGFPMKITINRGANVLKEKEIGRNIKQINFVPKKNSVKIVISDTGEQKIEQVETKPKTEEPVKEEPTGTVISITPEYDDFSVKKQNRKFKKKQKSDKPRNNGDSNRKDYPRRNDPDYYNRRPYNKSDYNNNTSVNDSPKLDRDLYRDQTQLVNNINFEKAVADDEF